MSHWRGVRELTGDFFCGSYRSQYHHCVLLKLRFDLMNLIESIAAVLAVILGSVVQAISGVGGGFIIVPLLAWIDLSLVPGPVVFGSIALSTIMVWRERQHIDLANVPMILIGLLPGCIAGAYLLTRVAGEQLGVVFGSVILLAVVISATGLKVSLNRFSALAAGLLSSTSARVTLPKSIRVEITRHPCSYIYAGNNDHCCQSLLVREILSRRCKGWCFTDARVCHRVPACPVIETTG